MFGLLAIAATSASACGRASNNGARQACPSSIPDYLDCPAGDFFCLPRTWSAVVSDTVVCSRPTLGVQFSVADCGDYHVAWWISDTGDTYYYYDSSSGMLIAVLYASLGATTCFGPSDGFVAPTCTFQDFHKPDWCSVDGGIDGTIRIGWIARDPR
jgi:hypothetical protein